MGSGEDTKTISGDDDDSQEDLYRESDYKEVIDKADKLQEDYHERESNIDGSNAMPNLSIGSWLTGITSGEVVDIMVDENTDDVLLDIRVNSGDIHRARVLDKNTKYTDRNEIVRLLEYKDIEEGRIEELLGKDVPIYIDRYALPSNEWSVSKWRPYIPRKLNRLGRVKHKINTTMRYLGYEGEFQGKMIAVAFLGVSLFWWSVFFGIISTGYIAMNTSSASYGIILTMMIILSFLMTVYTPLIMRIFRIIREKYIEIRKRDVTTK